MRYLKLSDILLIHRKISDLHQTSIVLRDLNALESSIAQPKATFDKKELYPTLFEKAAILCYSIIQNHPFLDGNKRVGHAAMETFLIINGFKIKADVSDQEAMILGLASGKITKEFFTLWLKSHTIQK
jgi:death on curing protein